MKKKIYSFLSEIGVFQTFLSLVLVFVLIVDNLIPSLKLSIKENNLFNWSIIAIFFIPSIIYIFKYNPMNVGDIKKGIEYQKTVSLIREFNYTISLVIVASSLVRFFNSMNFLPKFIIESSPGITNIITLIITIRLYFSVISIIMGVKRWVILLLIIIGIPLVYMIGVFNIGWWALISGIMIIWNFINSKDFLTLLNKGKEIDKIPKKLHFIWLRNKIVFSIVTTLVYLVLIISSLFEKEKMSILDRADIRIKSFAIFMMSSMFILVIILLIKYLYNHNKILQKFVNKRKESWFFTKLSSIIEFYAIYHKNIINLNNKKS